jgi:hypothetical protein
VGRPPVDAFFTAVDDLRHRPTVNMAASGRPFGHVLCSSVEIATGVLILASILGLVISRKLGSRQKLIAASDANRCASGGPVSKARPGGLASWQPAATVATSVLAIEVSPQLRFPGC